MKSRSLGHSYIRYVNWSIITNLLLWTERSKVRLEMFILRWWKVTIFASCKTVRVWVWTVYPPITLAGPLTFTCTWKWNNCLFRWFCQRMKKAVCLSKIFIFWQNRYKFSFFDRTALYQTWELTAPWIFLAYANPFHLFSFHFSFSRIKRNS